MSENISLTFMADIIKALNEITQGDWRSIREGYVWCRWLKNEQDGRELCFELTSKGKKLLIKSGGRPFERYRGEPLYGHAYEFSAEGQINVSTTVTIERGADVIATAIDHKILQPWKPVWDAQLENLETAKASLDSKIELLRRFAKLLGLPQDYKRHMRNGGMYADIGCHVSMIVAEVSSDNVRFKFSLDHAKAEKLIEFLKSLGEDDHE